MGWKGGRNVRLPKPTAPFEDPVVVTAFTQEGFPGIAMVRELVGRTTVTLAGDY